VTADELVRFQRQFSPVTEREREREREREVARDSGRLSARNSSLSLSFSLSLSVTGLKLLVYEALSY
jgi:hypothetical protein